MPVQNPTLLSATRGLLWVMLGLIVAAMLFVLIAAGALATAWPQIAVEARATGIFLNPEAMRPQLFGLFAILVAVLGIAVYLLRQLQALVATASADPFIPANAGRLRRIGWALVALQVLAMPLHWIASSIAVPTSKFANMGGLNLQSILAILLAFVLAAVFERGAAMREELEGTV